MRDYTLTHLSDAVLLRDLVTLVSRDRATTATLLAHIAEVDARRLYVPAGFVVALGQVQQHQDAGQTEGPFGTVRPRLHINNKKVQLE